MNISLAERVYETGLTKMSVQDGRDICRVPAILTQKGGSST